MLWATLQKSDAPSPPFRWLIYSWMHNKGLQHTCYHEYHYLEGPWPCRWHVKGNANLRCFWDFDFKNSRRYMCIQLDYQMQRSRLSSNASRPSFEQELSIGKKHCFSMTSREKSLHNNVECYCQRWDPLGTAIFIQQSPSITDNHWDQRLVLSLIVSDLCSEGKCWPHLSHSRSHLCWGKTMEDEIDFIDRRYIDL